MGEGDRVSHVASSWWKESVCIRVCKARMYVDASLLIDAGAHSLAGTYVASQPQSGMFLLQPVRGEIEIARVRVRS